MKEYLFRNEGTCSSGIRILTDGETLVRVDFVGGCSGNTQGVARLSEGRPLDEVITLLRGIRCGFKPTSCPDQLAQALELIRDGKESRRLQMREVEEC